MSVEHVWLAIVQYKNNSHSSNPSGNYIAILNMYHWIVKTAANDIISPKQTELHAT